MADEQETGFAFVDKRSAADSPDAASESDTFAEVPPQSAESSARSPFALPKLSAADRISLCINLLQEGSWISLGLVQDPATEKIEQDLDGARELIDCIAFLAGKIDAQLDEPSRRELKNLVRDLQLNFVQQQSRAGQS